MEEIWKPVPIDGLCKRYEVSNLGRIRRLPYAVVSHNQHGEHIRNLPLRILKLHKQEKGYVTFGVTLPSGKFKVYRVHRLVAMAFIPNPKNLPHIDHIDAVRDNNVVSNLQWCTMLENNRNPITRARRSETLKVVTVGRKHSEETKRKIAQSRLGRKMPQWVKDKISASKRGKHNPLKRTINREEE
jgi:NUMOD4 motif./NUMOD3 motif./HNH endonuclease.